jgi:hypothetical protein
MKKSIFLIVVCVAFNASIFAQTIPNAGFENFTTVGSYSDPDGWGTMNSTTALISSTAFTATKGTPGSPGSSYLKLTSRTIGGTVVNGIAVSGILNPATMMPVSGFAFNQRPATFTGKWQHMIYGSSQGSVNVTLTRWDSGLNQRVTVATANTTLSGMAMAWATFSKSLSYIDGGFPDSCIIVLKASGSNPTNNDYLWVDNLTFTGSVAATTGIEESKSITNLMLYPNPASENVTIEFNSLMSSTVKMELVDITGKTIKIVNVSAISGDYKYTMNTVDIAKGIYFLKISFDKSIGIKKLVVN